MAAKKESNDMDGGGLSQDLIDQLLNEGSGDSPTSPAADPWSDEQLQSEIESARLAAGMDPVAPGTPVGAAVPPPATVAVPAPSGARPESPPTAVHPVQFMPLQPEPPVMDSSHGIELLLDVQLEISVELGRSHMSIGEVLALRTGSVIELDKLAGEPVDVSVNGTLIARGEVVVVDEKFGVRITEVVSKAKRLASLG